LSLSRGCGILHSKISVTESSLAHRIMSLQIYFAGLKKA